VIEEVVSSFSILHNAPVTGALPFVIVRNDGIGRIFLPWSQEPICSRYSFSVVAIHATAGVAGVEEIKFAVMAKRVGAPHYTSLPARGFVGD
jgi:hypothetical protein